MSRHPKASKRDSHAPLRPDGQIRQSQLVTTFGPGAMVDLVDRAVVVGGLEHWHWGDVKWTPLDDPRLRRALLPRLKALAPDLDLAPTDYFRTPPECSQKYPTLSAGVRALEFPRWLVCQQCRRLGRAGDVFEPTKRGYRHQCATNKQGRAIPVRFVSACRKGHLSDFPWRAFAHHEREGGICDRPELYLREGATGDLGKIRVECESCGSKMAMSAARGSLFRCDGDRPWLGGRAVSEKCDLHSELLVRTASHAYFAQVVSALRLPPAQPSLATRRVREPEVWKLVQKVKNVEQLQMLADLQEVVAGALKGLALPEVLAAIEAERSDKAEATERPLRSVEFERIVSAPDEQPGNEPEEGVEFAAYRVPRARVDLPRVVRGLIVLPELREIRVQVSFSRFDSVSANLQGEFDFERARLKPAALTLPGGNQKWLPAAQVRGEGIFVELDEDAVQAWERRPAVVARANKLMDALTADGRGDFAGARFYMLHSLAHLLLTAISLECGYAASAIRERIYCQAPGVPGEPAMAAIMLSTGTTGSEGTLGGLVEEGRRLRHHLREAWDLGRLCSNDPVCAAHDPSSPSSDRRTEGAACHGCLYIAECSCERFNRFLDRALVVPTLGNDPDLAFFRDRP
ncbi:DUF1998 domain-containing protein [Sandaracinus amylolyticus]|uniref:DUF1998 domain-containing protein n=1 Tax=Sandaracinus amylolyticus TaxID=927083 RepID=UPI001F271B2A|nr:DUF1998 domain-containing protein [Sandaracinus amylolyticus]UJR84191.1 Hypothetical protein I5071_62620 [Sandaracinus amylolyticus]